MKAHVDAYLTLTAEAIRNPSEANIDALEAYEAAYPWIVDAAYQKGLAEDPDPTVRVNS